MPLFVISWKDKPGSLPARTNAREAHLAYLKGLGDKIKLGGPYLDGEGQMAGSLIILEADSLEEVRAINDKDPYRLAGIVGDLDISAWRLVTKNLD